MIKSEDPFSTKSPYEALEVERRKRLVLGTSKRAILYSIGLFPVFVGLLVLNYSFQLLIAIILLVGIMPMAWLLRKLALENKPDLGSQLFVAYLVAMFFIISLLVESFHAFLVPGYLVLVLISGMILTPTRTYQIAGLVSFLYLTSQIVVEFQINRIQLPNTMGEVVGTIIIVVAFIVTAVVIDMSTRDLRAALDEATQGLLESNKELMRASEMKSQFTARTTHELRTPLSSIIVFTDLALREAYGPLNKQLRRALEYVVQSARKLKIIINNILDLSKIEAGELSLDICPINIHEVIQSEIKKLEALVEGRDIDFILDISESLPAEMFGDEERIKQIIFNLVSNSLKFTEVGYIKLSVQKNGAQHWSISVTDTGKGIPYNYQKHIFKPYFQLEPVAGALESTGLGLAITKQIVSLMGGEIHLDSRLGRGTTVKIDLPFLSSDEYLSEPENQALAN
ncbi:MAG: HAMP domain-containing sensor histidine kinase [Anaerolineales bacterium]|jgi:signal transduction histidine kinase